VIFEEFSGLAQENTRNPFVSAVKKDVSETDLSTNEKDFE